MPDDGDGDGDGHGDGDDAPLVDVDVDTPDVLAGRYDDDDQSGADGMMHVVLWQLGGMFAGFKTATNDTTFPEVGYIS
jgi:hypothetical protein